ncbi:uncharacterized protein LOC142231180 [Haematobia irritans]|uniref:uncharacterized protein LOC142231180 n=1 Tax=Haematobia irritans TaxID=7368 RepID=UPI003F5054E8
MSNPSSSLIRPPVLSSSIPQPPSIPSQPSTLSPQQLTSTITEIVQNVLETRFQNVFQTTANTDFSKFSDQAIDPAHVNDFTGLDKIPDVVRCLREFSGNPEEFNSWRKSVDRVLQIYEPIRGTSKYYGILNTIRNKITGSADTALESYNTPLNWKAISKCLTLHFADKRDIRTLEYQMISLVQGNQTVQDFYQKVYTHLSLILNKIGSMDLADEPLQLLTQTYRDKALDTFVRGLKGDLARLLGMKEPTDLPQALHLCLKLENQDFRSNYASKIPQETRYVPRKNVQHKDHPGHRTFFPQLAHIPQPQTSVYRNNNFSLYNPVPQTTAFRNTNFSHRPVQNFYNGYQNIPQQPQFVPPRPFAPKPQARPEPMEVDPSLRSNRINYMNRPNPNDFQGKRSASLGFQNPTSKVQRNFHLETNNTPEEMSYYSHPPSNVEPSYQPVYNNSYEVQEYFQQIPQESVTLANQQDQPDDFSDLHFLDTGSTKNYIQATLPSKIIPNEESFFAKSVAGQIEITHHTFINLFNVRDINLKFYILPTLTSFHGILGHDSLKELGAVMHLKENYMTISNGTRIKLFQKTTQAVNAIDVKDDHMTKDQKEKLGRLISKVPNLFAEPDRKLTFTTKVIGEIRTKNDTPVYTRYYPYPMSLKSEVEKQVQELLKDGIIRPSRSPYNSPVWIVPKKPDSQGNKQYRLVTDYRKLNSVTIADRYPIPDITEVLAQLGSNTFFSVLDLKSGFHQIPLKESDIEKTAFSINNGKYEYTRLAFGLKNAPSIFQRALDDILRECIGVFCYVYIDDIIVFSKSENEHIQHLEEVFQTLEDANMKVQLDKCHFFKKSVEFLGFIISSEGITTNPAKTEAISKFPPPTTLKELRSFLGLSGYYRRFIQDYAKLAKPLTSLLRGEEGRVSKNQSKSIRINLDSEALAAFQKIKSTLVSRDIILTYPDFTKDFDLTTDASNFAIGAVLSQEDKPIMFISRTLSKTEENYATNEKEMLAIIWALNSLRNYLYGTAKVNIFTDHQPLTYALSNKNNNSKMKRWKAILEEYNYELHYKPGKANVVADAMSRIPNVPVNTLTSSVHSDESSSQNLIYSVNVPINAFKNQILLETNDSESSYQFKIIFPTYHRHIITEQNFNSDNLVKILKRYLNPSVINCIKTTENTMGKIQEIYPLHFSSYKIRFSQVQVEDVTNDQKQQDIISRTHNRAHRNARENKIQIIEKYYFPSMNHLDSYDSFLHQTQTYVEKSIPKSNPFYPVLTQEISQTFDLIQNIIPLPSSKNNYNNSNTMEKLKEENMPFRTVEEAVEYAEVKIMYNNSTIFNDPCIPRIINSQKSSCTYTNSKHIPQIENLNQGVILLNDYNDSILINEAKRNLAGTILIKFMNSTITAQGKMYRNLEAPKVKIISAMLQPTPEEENLENLLTIESLNELHLNNTHELQTIKLGTVINGSSTIILILLASIIGFIILRASKTSPNMNRTIANKQEIQFPNAPTVILANRTPSNLRLNDIPYF